MRLDKRRLILLLLAVFTVLGTVIIAQKQGEKEQYIVEDLKADDIPADDGSGLVLSWKPLDRSKRVIEYRIYRGTSPDQLFFMDAIPVNVKSGVTAERMFYYDNSGAEFIDTASPGKLRKEKQQDDKSPLYRKLPRDIRFLAGLGSKFQLLSIVDIGKYYYSSKAVTMDKPTKPGADGVVPEEGKTYAGLKSSQQSVICFLKPGEKYFYTVVAVNERSKLQKYAPIVTGSPVPNPPDPASNLYSVVMEDAKELRFEWDYPLFKDDISQYRIHKLPAINDTLWAQMKANPEAVQNLSTVVAEGPVGSGSLKNYTKVPIPAEAALASFVDARYCLELMDYDGFSSLSSLSAPQVKTTKDLPPQVDFIVEDKPNDKGDRLTVVWDNPICTIVKTTTLNKNFTKLRVNYQLNKTESQFVKNIYFKFFKMEDTTPFVTLKEYYQDSKLVLNVPADYDYKKGFRVEITMEGKPEIPKDYVLSQELNYDETMLALMPGKELLRNGVDVSKISNVVFRKGIASPNLTLVKRNTSFDNNLDVSVPYLTAVQKPVQGFSYAEGDSLITYLEGASGMERNARKLKPGDIKTPITLLSADIDLTYDKKNETRIETSIFPAVAKKQAQKKVEELRSQLAELNKNKAEANDPAMIANLEKNIDKVSKQLAAFSDNEELKKANSINGKRSRMRYVGKTRADYSRYSTYQVVRTNSKGLFTESEMLKEGDDLAYFKPISNWIDTNKYATLIAMLIFGIMVITFVKLAKKGKSLYIRPIAGLHEIPNAVGRATEMGRPMLYCMGNGGLSDVATIASFGILSFVAKQAAEYDTKLI
ncbi:MAG: hypothetical protein PHO32_08640, partial [Candidatus Cloacimonetes bacterium]|nr:hypothetical protein [Candidatus Cloacimonadota bacterium]